MWIDAAWLREHGVCNAESEIAGFEAEFGAGGEVTRANLIRAARSGRNLHWFANRILEPPAPAAFLERVGEARREMERAADKAHAAFHRHAVTTAAPGGARSEHASNAHHLYAASLDVAQREFRLAVADALADALGLPPDEPIAP